MPENKKYLVIDIGTGNVRVAVTDTTGHILSIASDDVKYHTDKTYPDSIYFDPELLWTQILSLARQVIEPGYAADIVAVTSSSQREGIVVIDKDGASLLGMPNIDHRGREYEHILQDKNRVYQLTGRYPTSLFSALKLTGLKEKRPEIAGKIAKVLSISDWALFQVSGVTGYEHSQASETLLYDVEKKCWSDELCHYFGISPAILPPLVDSGTIYGTIASRFAQGLGLYPATKAIVGGADTQLAVESTLPLQDDVVLVSGTTTPVIKIVSRYITDDQQRTWTNSHTTHGYYILETNAGVTGLNYQRFKTIFYPNEDYDVMEQEVLKVMQSPPQCYAALGSLLADEKQPLLKGGFIFHTPLSHALVRGHFTFALLWDIACSIYENYKSLAEVTPCGKNYVWACGGGAQSRVLQQMLANLLNKEIRIRENYRQATVVGGTVICNRALGIPHATGQPFFCLSPDSRWDTGKWYESWKTNRQTLKSFSAS